MTAPASPRRLSASNRRDQILTAAHALFTERGFEAVGMADLAAALQTSRPTIYSYFPSPDAILEALFDDLLRDLPDRLFPHLGAQEPIPFHTLFLALLQERALITLLYSGGGPTFRTHRRAFLNSVAGRLTQGVLPEVKTGALERQPLLLPIILNLLTSLAYDHLTQDHPLPTAAQLAETLGAFITGGVGAVIQRS